MENKDCCYEEMSKDGIYEQSEVKTDKVPNQNDFELKRNSEFNQSGFSGGK